MISVLRTELTVIVYFSFPTHHTFSSQIASEAIKVTSKMLTPPGGRLFGKYFDKHIRSEYFCYHSKEKVWADVLNTHNTTIWLMKKFLRRFEKKVWKFLKSKYASSLSQFYMAIVVFWMKFWLWMSLKNFLCTFQACSTYLKGSPEPGLFNARWIECLRCVKHKLTLTKAQRMSNFVLSSHIWSLMARSG